MKKELRNKVLEKVGDELNCKGFLLVDSSSKWMIFHRKSDSYIEIVQIAQDKYETILSVSVSIAFLDVPSEITNINYVFFCDLIIQRLKKAYRWLDKKKQGI